MSHQEGEFSVNEQQNSQGQNGQSAGNTPTTKPVGIDPRLACSAETKRTSCFVQGGAVKYLPF